jgi:hypothetical protein
MEKVIIILSLAFAVFLIATKWKIFTKAGEPGWASLVPIYDVCVFLKIAGKPMWWVLILWVPILGLILAILAVIELARRFGKGGGYAVGLIFLPIIFYPMLAFGDAKYQQ